MKLMHRLDDAINPIVVKELRQAVQSRVVSVVLLLFLAIQLLVVGINWFGQVTQSGGELNFTGGRSILMVVQGVLATACLIFVPIYAGVRLALERADANADLLFISTLKPRAIVSGKFFAAFVVVTLIFSACAPFITFAYLLRGIDLITVFLILFIDLMAVMLVTQFALLLAVLPFNRWMKGLAGLASLGLVIAILFGVIGSSAGMIESGAGMQIEDWKTWLSIASSALVVLLLIGLLFVSTVALLSPLSANRTLMPRLYLLFLWAVTAALFYFWSLEEDNSPLPLQSWLVGAVLLLCFCLLITINERDNWGPRVRRAIPRSRLLRPWAFLLYSGAAGGILFDVLLLVLSFVVYWSLTQDLTHPFRPGSIKELGIIMEILALYTFNFAMAGLLCRSWLLNRWLKPAHTWGVTAALVGVASFVPPICYALVVRSVSGIYYTEFPWWFLSNPFASIISLLDAPSRAMEYGELCLFFNWIWAAATIVVAFPWFISQFRRFQPLAPQVRKTVDPTANNDVVAVLPLAPETV